MRAEKGPQTRQMGQIRAVGAVNLGQFNNGSTHTEHGFANDYLDEKYSTGYNRLVGRNSFFARYIILRAKKTASSLKRSFNTFPRRSQR